MLNVCQSESCVSRQRVHCGCCSQWQSLLVLAGSHGASRTCATSGALSAVQLASPAAQLLCQSLLGARVSRSELQGVCWRVAIMCRQYGHQQCRKALAGCGSACQLDTARQMCWDCSVLSRTHLLWRSCQHWMQRACTQSCECCTKSLHVVLYKGCRQSISQCSLLPLMRGRSCTCSRCAL